MLKVEVALVVVFIEAVATRDAVVEPLRCNDVHLPFTRELVLRSFRFRYDEMRAPVLVHLAAVFAAFSRQNLLDLNFYKLWLMQKLQ